MKLWKPIKYGCLWRRWRILLRLKEVCEKKILALQAFHRRLHREVVALHTTVSLLQTKNEWLEINWRLSFLAWIWSYSYSMLLFCREWMRNPRRLFPWKTPWKIVWFRISEGYDIIEGTLETRGEINCAFQTWVKSIIKSKNASMEWKDSCFDK